MVLLRLKNLLRKKGDVTSDNPIKNLDLSTDIVREGDEVPKSFNSFFVDPASDTSNFDAVSSAVGEMHRLVGKLDGEVRVGYELVFEFRQTALETLASLEKMLTEVAALQENFHALAGEVERATQPTPQAKQALAPGTKT